MTIYGESDTRFRPRPSKTALAAVSSSLFLIFLLITAYCAAAGDLIVADRHGLETIALDATLLSAPRLHSGTAATAIERAAIPATLIVFGAIALFFVPTSQNLEARLAVHLFALACATTALRILTIGRESMLMLAAGGFAVLLAYAAEKSASSVLAQLYDLEHPMRRLTLLLIRLAIAFAVLGGISVMNDNFAALVSVAIVAVVAFLAALASKPAQRWEELRDPQMRESAAVLPLLTVAAIAAHIWFFGMSPLREERFLWYANDAIRLVPRSGIDGFVRSKTKPPETPATEKQGDPSIKIEWAR